MLETYIKDHPERAAGIILVGSYLPDLFGDQSNQFPVPVLTAVGELDGMTISYVYRCIEIIKINYKISDIGHVSWTYLYIDRFPQ